MYRNMTAIERNIDDPLLINIYILTISNKFKIIKAAFKLSFVSVFENCQAGEDSIYKIHLAQLKMFVSISLCIHYYYLVKNVVVYYIKIATINNS